MSGQNPEPDFNITDPIFAWAARAPNAVAIIEQDKIISYAGLCIAVSRAMLRFREAGWRDGDIIGVSIRGEASLHLVVTLALARIGVTQVTLAPGDPALSRLSMAQALGVKAVVINHDGERLGAIPNFVPDAGWLSAVDMTAVPPDSRGSGGDNIWSIFQTSGTTGEPKNVRISHEVERIRNERPARILSCRPAERFMNMVSLRFRMGLGRAMRCLSEGGAFVALPETFSVAQLLYWIDLHHVTYLSCTPIHLHVLLQEVRDESPRLPGLRVLRCGSAELIPTLLQDARTRLSPNFFFVYGANEAGTMTAATPDILDRFPESVGLPLPGVEFEIVDAEGHRVPTGTVGRVRVRGEGTQPSMRNSLLDEGWHYPGDTALQNEEGIVFLKGRYDEVMNYDGILVGPMEIESVLARHPSVAEVAAFALPSPQHQDVPAVALILKQPLSQDELNRYCAEHLGIRAPKVLILVDKMPRNAMGKVLRRRLTEIALQRLSANSKPG